MSERPTTTTWNTAPERYYQDLVAQNATLAAEQMRDIFLRMGLSALQSSDSDSLLLPPLKAYSPKQAVGRKDLHVHRYVEIGIVTRGEMTIWWEGTTTRCPAGSIFVIPPGIRYMPHVQTTEHAPPPHSVIWLAVHKSYAVAHMCSLEGNRHLLSEYYSFTNSLLMSQARIVAQELADRSPHFQTAVRGGLMCLLTWLMRAPAQPLSQFSAPKSPGKGAEDEDFGGRVREYFLSHYHRPLTLTQVARAVGRSPAYLCRRFRELTGETPFHFLRHVRIEAAKRLLSSEVPIARVAEMVGFDDPLYFSKVFARHTGESPQKFRAGGGGKGAKPAT